MAALARRFWRFSPLFFLVVLGFFSQFVTEVPSDSHLLILGSGKAASCLAHGIFKDCPDVQYFPLIQYLMAVPLKALGMADKWVFKILVAASYVSFLGIVRIFQRWGEKEEGSEGLAPLALLLLFASPLIYYTRSTFGELLASFLTLAFVEACARGRSFWRVAGLAFLAGLTKETAAPFLGLLAVGCALGRGPRRASGQTTNRSGEEGAFSRTLSGFLLGVGASLIAGAAFNVFRFGVPFNAFLLDPVYRVPVLSLSLNYFIALFFSPQGGLVFHFFPFCCVLLLALPRIRSAAGWAGIGSLLLLELGFSRWYSPFGWQAWGSRLLLPWIPSVIFVLFWGDGPRVVEAVRRAALWLGGGPKASGWRARVVPAALWGIALPQALILLNSFPIQRIFRPSATCPSEPQVQQGAEYFYRCVMESIWTRHPAWLDLYAKLGDPRYLLMAALYAVVISRLWTEFIRSASLPS